jgi:two-component system sensor histidine kinase BaeS
MSRWFHSLRGRITLVTVAVAVLAVLGTGLISLQLVKQSSVDDARQRLAAQAALLSRLPPATTLAELTRRADLALGRTEVGIVTSAGVTSGPATSYLTARDIRVLLNGKRLSVTRKSGGGTELVEAKRTKRGGAVVLATPIDQAVAATAQTQRRIAIALLIGVAAALIAGALLGRWVSRPLVETAGTARRMARGERGLRLTRRSPSEVADVGDALITLDAALANSEARQREFLLSISHELRTPITAIRGYAEALGDGMIAPTDIPKVGATLVAETERLDHFVADLLELARLEADDFSLESGPVDVRELLAQVARAWGALAERSGVTIAATSVGRESLITSDARRLRQILDGLVENALRVAPAGTAVGLRSWVTAGSATLEVRDQGPGLDPADRVIAFERGALRERYRDIRPVGTGLGLSIAARLCARLGASISVSSADGTGTEFTVTIPAARPTFT